MANKIGPLVDLRSLKAAYEFMKIEDVVEKDLEDALVDIRWEDVKKLTPFEEIEAAIQYEVSKEENKKLLEQGQTANAGSSFLLLHSKIPNYNNLTQTTTANLQCVKEATKEKQNKKKRRRREVNYLTTNMFEPIPTYTEADPNEIILSISFYHPKKNRKLQEWLVLGSQPLSVLRDKIYCLSDTILDGANVKSAYFFIENTFYDDMRQTGNTAYSKYIIKWLNEKKRTHSDDDPVYTSKKMEDTKWHDLSLRCGARYLYCHQGYCEHYIVINAVRIISKNDDLNVNVYPMHTFQSKLRRRKCKICDIYPAKWVTYGDSLSTENPCFYCNHCYRPLHYTYEGELLNNDYEVYPYYHE